MFASASLLTQVVLGFKMQFIFSLLLKVAQTETESLAFYVKEKN